MSPTEHIPPPAGADEPQTAIERSEEVLSWVGLAAVGTIRVAELAAILVAALLVVPPLAILVAVVVIPAIALTAVGALLAAIVAGPVFLIRHAHPHRGAHAHHVVRRLADLGRAEHAATASRVRRVVARAQRKLYAKPAR